MKILGCLIVIVLSGLSACCQLLNGTYCALELNGLNIDTTGNVHFYLSDSFPKQTWFHEIRVVIMGDNMMIQKFPVYYDRLHHKKYSASDGGFLTYKGTVAKAKDVYIANAKLVNCDYIGFTGFQPPVANNDSSGRPLPGMNPISKNYIIDTNKFDRFKAPWGFIYLPKGIIRLDCIIRPDSQGIWINNRFYYKKRD
jgi:hypothetical protein